jgi:glutaconate CoA-transferase subunit A
MTAEEDEKQYAAFLDKYLFGVRSFDEYLQLCGGLPRIQELRRQEFLLNRGR